MRYEEPYIQTYFVETPKNVVDQALVTMHRQSMHPEVWQFELSRAETKKCAPDETRYQAQQRAPFQVDESTDEAGMSL